MSAADVVDTAPAVAYGIHASEAIAFLNRALHITAPPESSAAIVAALAQVSATLALGAAMREVAAAIRNRS